jgi:uncharacterized protein YbcI
MPVSQDGSPPRQPTAAGELNAALARGAVRIARSVVGRGPAKAHAFFHDNVFVVLLEDTQTRAEKSLVEDGQGDTVLELRRGLQQTMRGPLVLLVERLTGGTVTAMMSASHVAPDLDIEVFVLDRPVSGRLPDAPQLPATD